jgi:HK97 family phage major capsid protein
MTKLKLGKQYRTFEVKAQFVARAAEGADAAEGDKLYPVVLATETPVERWYGIETLSLEKRAVDLSGAKRGIPFFMNHGGYPISSTPNPDLRVGRLLNLEIKDGQLIGDVRFSRTTRGQEAELDAVDGQTPYLSVGYVVDPKGMKITKRADRNNPDDKNEYLVTRWRPVEGSIVDFPADPKATFRSQESEQFEVEIEDASPTEEPMKLHHQNTPPGSGAGAPAPQPTAAVEVRDAGPGSPAAGAQAAATAATTAASSRAVEIIRLCEAHGLQTRAAEWIESGKSLADIKGEILDARASQVRPQPAAEALARIPAKDRKRFSYSRAIRQAVLARESSGAYDGLEAEIDQELRRQLPPTYQQRGGYLIPLTTLTPDELAERQVRAMGTGLAGAGAELVFDRPGEIIDILRKRSVILQSGGQSLAGLVGPVPFPKQTGDPTIRWMGENPASAAAASQLAFGTVLLSPKTMIGTVPFPRQLVNMASLDIEGRIRNSLGAQHGLEADRVGLHGKGTDGEPLGLWDTPGVATTAMGGAPDANTFGKLVTLGSQIADANADTDTMRYVTTPLYAGKLKSTLVASAAGSEMLWRGTFREGEVAGYRASSTGQVRKNLGGGADEHGLFFGDWSQITFGFWGAMEFIVDVVTLADKGQIKITTFQMFDSGVLRPESFALGTGAKIA